MTNAHPVYAELAANGETVLVTFDYNPGRVVAVKGVPSARFVAADKPEGPAWRLNLDLTTMKRLRETFADDLGLGPNLTRWGRKAVAQEKNLTELSQADDAELENLPSRMVKGAKVNGRKFKLREYQKADIKFMAATNVINANQPGAGKTIETIGALMETDLTWGQHLIFAPLSSLRNVWEDQIKFAYKAAGLEEPTVLTGDTPKERKAAIEQAKALAAEGYAFWLVLNPAMARTKRVVTGKGDNAKAHEELSHPALIEIEWDSITVDEFHLCGLSNPATAGARGINQIAEATQPAKRFALSGTPMGGKPVKLWGALHFLDPAKFRSRWNWAKHWLVINSNGYGSSIEGIMPGREVDFYDHLKPYLVRRTKREALPGLPPKQTINVWCSMTPKQADQYKTFASEAEWRIEDAEESGSLSATNILAEYTRLKQFAGAYCDVSFTGREVNGIPEIKVQPTSDSGKIDQLMEKLAEENVLSDDEPKCALVFSQFKGMVDAVAEAIGAKGVPVATLTGATTGKDRDELVKAFQKQAPGAPRVLVLNTMAGGSAITLSQADSVHLLDETWTPDNQEQAEDRAHRGDDLTMAKDEVRMYYYRTRGSIEEYIQKLVADKQLNNKTILDLRRRMQKDLAKAEAEAEQVEALGPESIALLGREVAGSVREALMR